ncbi:hypothetical protein BGZ97_001376 [Linnemannia gamsii]|uniref:Uncharacterized protein n=1 Tax=Linnemannia gamsii TaxID=64522 RepID=A0A9P6R1B2_9FUNG|nr:hypothetical protein BGZ97_001376 [Linnemannia gamsii]
MKILNITLSSLPLPARLLKSITAYSEVLSLVHDGIKAQVAALGGTVPGLAAIPEATPIHDAITKFVNALTAAETDKFSVAATVQAVADAAKELLAITRPANASIPPNILALVDRIFNAVKNIGETADAYLKAGCATTM